MADTSYGVNHPGTVKLWARRLWHEALKETYIERFIGSGTSSLIVQQTQTSKGAGDRVRQGLRMQLTGDGVTGDGDYEGQEEALTTYFDDVLIDQLGHQVKSAGKMSEQRVPFSVRQEAMDGLRDWWADRLDTWFFNQISGNTGEARNAYVGHNATTAPTSAANNTRILYADGGSTTEGSLSAGQVFQLTFLDRAVTTAKTATPVIRPIRYKGGEYYVAFLHPYQVYSLKTDATAGRVTWYDATKALVQGGQSASENGIFTGALGIYNNVILHEAIRLPVAPTNASTRRAVLCGAQSANMAYGQDNSGGNMTWVEKLFQYDSQLGVHARMIAGMKKSVFNGIDFGTVVITTYAVAP